MRTSRLYLPADFIAGQSLSLSKEQAHYALTVLRLKNGTPIEAFDGKGMQASGKLEVLGRREAAFIVDEISQSNNESPLTTVLVQGISRGDRMDHSIQKSVELGVTQIQPVFTARCEVKLQGDKLEKRRQQWQTIAINACEQSGRSVLPEVLPILTFDEWLQKQPQDNFGLVLDPYAESSLKNLQQPAFNKPISLLIGPEGGLTEKEVSQAKQAGLTAVQLGSRILRTETAGPSIIAILQALWGDF